ncbi:MAG: biotin/lipoyl-containing protein [Ruminiclostridium sp.]
MVLQEILVPQENSDDDYIKVHKLYFKSGSPVKLGETIIEIETVKVNIYVEAEFDGYVKFFFNEGDEMESGDVIAIISDEAW